MADARLLQAKEAANLKSLSDVDAQATEPKQGRLGETSLPDSGCPAVISVSNKI